MDVLADIQQFVPLTPLPSKKCAPPTCHRESSGNCVLPNPWNVFMMSEEVRGMTSEQRSEEYKKWKVEYMARVGNDPVAFNAALCLKKSLPSLRRKPVVRRYLRGLRERLAKNRIHYVKECHIDRETKEFFDKLIPTSAEGTTLSTCQMVGMAALKKCVPPEEAKFYMFEKVLGVGLHGFVFLCRYKRTQHRAVKVMALHKGGKENEFSLAVNSSQNIDSTSETSFLREVKMHQTLMKLADISTSGFRVLKVVGNPSVIKPRQPLVDALKSERPRKTVFTNESRYRRIGVYVMEELPFETLDKEIGQWRDEFPGTPFPKHILDNVEETAKVIGELHSHGIVHSDLHPGNIAFDPKNPRDPYILDFGRTHMLQDIRGWETLYRIFDYCVPIYTYMHWLYYNERETELAVQICNAYFKGVRLNETDEALLAEQGGRFSFFEPIADQDIEARYNKLSKVLLEKKPFIYHNIRYNFFEITERDD